MRHAVPKLALLGVDSRETDRRNAHVDKSKNAVIKLSHLRVCGFGEGRFVIFSRGMKKRELKVVRNVEDGCWKSCMFGGGCVSLDVFRVHQLIKEDKAV